MVTLQFAYEEALRYADSLSETERSTSGTADKWMPRDILPHIGEGVKRMGTRLGLIRRGEDLESLGQAADNATVFEQYRDRSWGVFYSLLDKAYKNLLEEASQLSEDQLNTPADWANNLPLWRAVTGNSFLHPLIHLTQMTIERGQGEKALDLNSRAEDLAMRLDDSPDWQGLYQYNNGCYYALLGNKSVALNYLEKGFKLAPQYIEFSREDPDLVSLHSDPDYLTLLERVQPAQA
jgi:tetratricopeptide (TPR) repeat protein